MKYGGKTMEKLWNRDVRISKCLISIIGWLLLARGFIAWVPFPWSIFPIVGTSIPLVLGPIYALRKRKGSSTGLSDRIKSQRPSSGVPDLDKILDRQAGHKNPDEDETPSIPAPEFFEREDKSIINQGRKSRKRRKFKDKY